MLCSVSVFLAVLACTADDRPAVAALHHGEAAVHVAAFAFTDRGSATQKTIPLTPGQLLGTYEQRSGNLLQTLSLEKAGRFTAGWWSCFDIYRQASGSWTLDEQGVWFKPSTGQFYPHLRVVALQQHLLLLRDPHGEELSNWGPFSHWCFHRTEARPAIDDINKVRASHVAQAVLGQLSSAQLFEWTLGPAPAENDALEQFVFSPDGRMLAVGSIDGTVRIWNTATGRLFASLVAETRWPLALAFSPDEKLLATGAGDEGILRLWDLATNRVAATLGGHRDEVILTVAFSPDGRLLACGGFAKELEIWDVARREKLANLTTKPDFVGRLAFSPDSRTLACGGMNGDIDLWDVTTLRPVASLKGHTKNVDTLAFSPDGKLLASGGFDGGVRVWSVGQRKCIAVLDEPSVQVTSLVFSRDGTQLFTAGHRYRDGRSFDKQEMEVTRWNVASGSMIERINQGLPVGRRPILNQDGCRLALDRGPGTIVIVALESRGPW